MIFAAFFVVRKQLVPVGHDTEGRSIFCSGSSLFLGFGRPSPARMGRDGFLKR